jgi:DNA helicase-2/ATP-dependent DNA helicase PcrA
MDEKEEAAFVVGVIREATNDDDDLAVLYRTNAQSRAIEEALIRRKIPYRLVGGVRFYDRAEIKDLLSGARLVLNPKDIVSWERIEKNFGKRIKAKVEIWTDKESVRLRELPPLEVLEEFAKVTAYFEKFSEKDEEDVGRLENIKELLWWHRNLVFVEFLESVALIQSDELAERNSNGAKVTLMTIHSAKGLEFDQVIIVGLEEGLLPHSRSLLDREVIEV